MMFLIGVGVGAVGMLVLQHGWGWMLANLHGAKG